MIREKFEISKEIIKNINYYKIDFNTNFDKVELKKSFKFFEVELTIKEDISSDENDLDVIFKIYENGVLTQTINKSIKYHYYELFDIVSFKTINGEDVLLAISKEFNDNDYLETAKDLISEYSSIQMFTDTTKFIEFLNPSIKEEFVFILYLSIHNFNNLNKSKYGDLKQYVLDLLEYYGYNEDYYIKNKSNTLSIKNVEDCLNILIIALLSKILDDKVIIDKKYLDKALHAYINQLYLLK